MKRILLLFLLASFPYISEAQNAPTIDTTDIYYILLKRYCETEHHSNDTLFVVEDDAFTKNIPAAIGPVKIRLVQYAQLQYYKDMALIVWKFVMLPYDQKRGRLGVMLNELHVTKKKRNKKDYYELLECGGSIMNFEFDCETRRFKPASFGMLKY